MRHAKYMAFISKGISLFEDISYLYILCYLNLKIKILEFTFLKKKFASYCDGMNVILYTSAVPRFVSISHQVYREICPTSTPTKPLTAFRIITFPSFYLMPKSQRQVLCSTSHRNALLLCSTNHTIVGHVSFGWSIYLHFLLMSSTVPKPKWIHRAKKKKKKEDKFQIENLMRMLRKCFITFKKIVKVSVKAHMILVSFLCHSLSFFFSFSTNKLPNVWVKPRACVCGCFACPKRTDKCRQSIH